MYMFDNLVILSDFKLQKKLAIVYRRNLVEFMFCGSASVH